MTAAASHPELYDALREAGASEGRARAALPADQLALNQLEILRLLRIAKTA